MYKSNLLAILREKTGPIHKKMDEEGVGHLMKTHVFDREAYRKWLHQTYLINSFLFSEKEMLKNGVFYDYINGDLGIDLIVKDIEEMGDSINIGSAHSDNISEHSHQHSDYLIAIAYTFIGSSLGSAYILNYVKDQISDAPTLFLSHMKQLGRKWKSFMEDLNSYEPDIDLELIGNYAESIFLEILAIQKS